MINSQLLDIIRALPHQAREEMTLFLDSPFFVRGANVGELKKLYQVILKAAPDFREAQLGKETVYAQVFENQPFVSGKLEKRMVELNKLLRIFILTKRYWTEENETLRQLDWTAWLREAGMAERAQATFAKIETTAKEEHTESLGQYRLDLQVAEEEHEIKSIQNLVQGDIHIPDLLDSLDLYYQNYRIELLNRYALQQKGTVLPDMDTGEKTPEYYAGRSLLYRISLAINQLLKDENPAVEAFQQLLTLLKNSERRLPFQVQQQFYTYLRNLCTLLINKGQIHFAQILNELYKDNLARGLFFTHGEISTHLYINIVQIALRVKDYEWATTFTENYKSRLIGGDKDQLYYRFNLSHCLFEEKKLDEALTQLPEAAPHFHYLQNIRRLELKIYYELGSDLLQYKMYAFRKYFERTARKSLSPELREMHIEFFNILLQILQSPPKDKERSQKLIERIQKKKLLADRAWLLEKARELG
ncbi:MAG: hypothetical protein SFV22_07935 [Saprospiraceae bacterium]|nr:hypothetical protein [Saprospiraceae bacterium]